MVKSIDEFNSVFFIGVAGVGMSALAQYLKGIGKQVSGSDRYFTKGEVNETKDKLEARGIHCFFQDGEGISSSTDLVVVSTAIEDTVFEVVKAKELQIPIIKRSDLLSLISDSKKTVAVAGTSGKSSTAGMLFHILFSAGLEPSVITGAGLTSLIRKGEIGNAYVGKGEWLIIEADESDGSLVKYHPEIGLLLNIDKDHQEMDELLSIFSTFKSNTKEVFITNQSHPIAKELSERGEVDFGYEAPKAKYNATDLRQDQFKIHFLLQGVEFEINALGVHSVENAAAAIAVANRIGVDLETCATALASYAGIFRRHQILGQKGGVWVVDDYAHNPAKCAASIKAVQPVAEKVIAWFQPHGYGPTRFLKDDFIEEISKALREEDEIWMSEIYYAGGSAVKDISANDLIKGIQEKGKKAFFVEDREHLLREIQTSLTPSSVILLMGARDPSLEEFAHQFFSQL